jgi:hypothetical protein
MVVATVIIMMVALVVTMGVAITRGGDERVIY